VLTPGAGTGGQPRPLPLSGLAPGSVGSAQVAAGAIGTAQINTSQVQARVTGTCDVGFVWGIHANGTVSCAEPYIEVPVGSATFDLKPVPPVGQTAAQLATIFFHMPVSGTVILRGRGYCNVSPIAGQENVIDIAAGVNAAIAFIPVSPMTWGVVGLPSTAGAGVHRLGWTSERRIEGVPPGSYTMGLFGRHESGTVSSDCAGSLSIHLLAGATIT
jgi:hypothetical protein